MSIFISYRRKLSKDFATTLKYAFNEYTADKEQIFLDQTNLEPGSDYPDDLHNALNDCKIFVPIIQGEYLKEFENRISNQIDDWVFREIEAISNRINAGDDVVKILPVYINCKDFSKQSIDESQTLEERHKTVLDWLANKQTNFIFSESPGSFFIQKLVLSLHSELEKLEDNLSISTDLVNFIDHIKKTEKKKILVIGPTALYDIEHIQNISKSIMSKLSDIIGNVGSSTYIWARKTLGNNLLKCCEFFINKYGEINKYEELSRILNEGNNYNGDLLNTIADSIKHFDIILDFTILFKLRTSDQLQKNNFQVFDKIITDREFLNELGHSLDKVVKEDHKLYLPIQRIIDKEHFKSNPSDQYTLLTTEEYLKFIKTEHKNLESLNAMMKTKDALTLFCGIGEVDMILKNLFLEDDEIIFASRAPKAFDPTQVKPRALLYGSDFEFMHKGYYESKSFIVERMSLDEFLGELATA